MSLAVRAIAFAGVAAVLGGLGWLTLRPQNTQATAVQTANGCLSGGINARHYSFGTWFLVVNQRDNRVDWDPKGMVCNQAAGTADVTIQITHRTPQFEARQTDTGASILTQETYFTKERQTFRFNCKERTIAALARSIMGEGEEAIQYTDLTRGAEPIFLPYGENGIGQSLDGPVCTVGMGIPRPS